MNISLGKQQSRKKETSNIYSLKTIVTYPAENTILHLIFSNTQNKQKITKTQIQIVLIINHSLKKEKKIILFVVVIEEGKVIFKHLYKTNTITTKKNNNNKRKKATNKSQGLEYLVDGVFKQPIGTEPTWTGRRENRTNE